jgi:ATP/maltotriose-dependent transcriptional regulator MalT
VIEAVRHALAAPDFEQAAHLIEQYGLAIGGQGQYSTILGWLDALPEPLVRGNARLSLLYATALRTTDQLEAIEARLQDAERCVEAGMPTEEARVVVGWVTVVRASLALYTGDHAGCVSLARDAEAKARMGSSLEILLLRALAWQAEGSDNNALADLERALVLAEPQGYIRLFLDEGPAMLDLLRVAGSRGLAPDYIATLLTASGEEPATAMPRSVPRSAGLVDPLSQRELEVLRLLAGGASNEEIAERLVIAVSTAKRHVSNIFGKLTVSSRTQAVARARALGLL